MKILQIVTYMSVNSEFGGPSQVSQNILYELNKSHSCEIMALSNYRTITDDSKSHFNEMHLFRSFNLFPKLGFAGIINFKIFFKFIKIRKKFDIVHIHLARDLVSLPLALICMLLRKPYVLQTHGMIDPSKRKMAKFLDIFVTRKVMRSSELILSLSKEEDSDLLAIEKQINLIRFINAARKRNQVTRQDKVVFVGRMAEDKRPDLLVKAAHLFLKGHHHTIFEFIGPNSGLLKECKQIVSAGKFQENFLFRGPLNNSETVELVSQSKVLVLPSPKDRFPLAVVEALSTGTPVVISKGNGLAELISEYQAGIVSNLTEIEIASAIRTIYESFEDYRKNADKLFDDIFDVSVNTKKLICIYQSIIMNMK